MGLFLPDPPGSKDNEPVMDQLKQEFKGRSPKMHDLFEATNIEVVHWRNLFDRPPMMTGLLS